MPITPRDPRQSLDAPRQSAFARRHGDPLDMLLSPSVRMLLALLLLVGSGAWCWNNRDFVLEEWRQIWGTSKDPVEIAKGKDHVAHAVNKDFERRKLVEQHLKSREAPGLAKLLGSWNAMFAGVMLLYSTRYRGKAVSMTSILGAAVAVVGASLTGIAGGWTFLAIGAGIILFGFFFYRGT